MDNLDSNVLKLVFKSLDYVSLGRLRRVCKRLRNIVDGSTLFDTASLPPVVRIYRPFIMEAMSKLKLSTYPEIVKSDDGSFTYNERVSASVSVMRCPKAGWAQFMCRICHEESFDEAFEDDAYAVHAVRVPEGANPRVNEKGGFVNDCVGFHFFVFSPHDAHVERRRHRYQYCNALIVLFDCSSPLDVEAVTAAIGEFRAFCAPNRVDNVLLVANKCDLPHRKPRGEALNLARRLCCSYLEVSAKTGENLREPLFEIGRLIGCLEYKHPEKPDPEWPVLDGVVKEEKKKCVMC